MLQSRQKVKPTTVEGLPPLDEAILNDVRKFGRLPRELQHKRRELTDEQKLERSLAQRIRTNKDKLLPTTQVALEEMQSDYKWISVVKAKRVQLQEAHVDSEKKTNSNGNRSYFDAWSSCRRFRRTQNSWNKRLATAIRSAIGGPCGDAHGAEPASGF